MARYVAKNIDVAGLANKCELQIAYAIGIAHPVSVMVDTFAAGKFTNNEIDEAVNQIFDLRPAALLKALT